MEILGKKTKVKGDSTNSYYRYEAMVRRLLTLVGLWPSENSVWSYYIRIYFILFLMTVNLAGIINHVLHDVSTTQEIIVVVSFLTTTLMTVLKICLITINRKEVSEIYKKLQKLLCTAEQEGRLIDYAFERGDMCYILVQTYTIVAFVSFFGFAIPFLLELIREIRDPTILKFQLIYPARYPWDPRSNRLVFIGTYTMEMMMMFSVCVTVPGIDGFVLLLICQGVINLRAMAYQLKNIEKSEDHEEVMKKCVQNWIFTTHLRDEVQRIYGPLIIFSVVTGTLLVCTVMHQLARVDVTMVYAIRMSLYSFAKILQIYINTWLGTLLQEESEKYLTDVYLSDWFGARSSRSTYITLLQRPLVMRACHVLDVSVQIFAKTMNTTISYYLILRTVA